MADHPVDEKLPAPKMATTGLQHVAAMYAGVVAPPLIVGAAVGLTPAELTFLTGACLFTAGLATFLQTVGVWKIGARLPFVNGVTFAACRPHDRDRRLHRRQEGRPADHLRRGYRSPACSASSPRPSSARRSASSLPWSPAP